MTGLDGALALVITLLQIVREGILVLAIADGVHAAEALFAVAVAFLVAVAFICLVFDECGFLEVVVGFVLVAVVFFVSAFELLTFLPLSLDTLIPDDASVTKTFTAKMSVTIYLIIWTTTTKSATATKTKVIPGPTEYAACSEGNDSNSGGIGYFITNVLNNGPGIPSDFQIVANGAGSPDEGCSSCMQFASCETWIDRAKNRNCFLLYHAGSTCKTQGNHPNFFMSKKGADSGAGFVVGNGKCGFTYSGNSDGSLFSVDA